MDDRYEPRPLASWYMPGAITSLLAMALGCVALAIHLTADPAELPLDQRVLFEAEPGWMLAASAVAFVAGTAGALLLILRSKAGAPLMAVSLLGILVRVAGTFATPSFRDLLSTGQIAILLVIAMAVWTICGFARHSRQRGWLR